jgi:hypothetical protein
MPSSQSAASNGCSSNSCQSRSSKTSRSRPSSTTPCGRSTRKQADVVARWKTSAIKTARAKLSYSRRTCESDAAGGLRHKVGTIRCGPSARRKTSTMRPSPATPKTSTMPISPDRDPRPTTPPPRSQRPPERTVARRRSTHKRRVGVTGRSAVGPLIRPSVAHCEPRGVDRGGQQADLF